MTAPTTDRELLELAAKAIGRCLHRNTRDEHGNCGTDTYCTDCGKGTYGEHWNPLTADGDALRLAAVLRMEIDHNHPSDSKPWVSVRAAPTRICAVEDFEDESQRITATRRAIVRAAAAIGKAMP